MPDTYVCDAYDARSELLFGREALERLADSVVVVYGLGGVGSSCVEALARGGVGGLVLVDRDVVEPSNINRQAIAFRSTLGREKTDVMRDMVADIRPRTRVRTCHMFVTCDNAHVPLDVAWRSSDGWTTWSTRSTPSRRSLPSPGSPNSGGCAT